MKAWALWYARQAFQIFPCEPAGKAPLARAYSIVQADRNKFRPGTAEIQLREHDPRPQFLIVTRTLSRGIAESRNKPKCIAPKHTLVFCQASGGSSNHGT